MRHLAQLITVSRAINLPPFSLITRAVWQQRSTTELLLAYGKSLLIACELYFYWAVITNTVEALIYHASVVSIVTFILFWSSHLQFVAVLTSVGFSSTLQQGTQLHCLLALILWFWAQDSLLNFFRSSITQKRCTPLLCAE
jgi:hypothetical protein